MSVQQFEDRVVISTAPGRVQQAREAHRAVARTAFIAFGALTAVILAVGIPLSLRGRASLWGIIVVAAVFIAVPFLMARSTKRLERRAERFVAADGATQFVVGRSSLTVGDVELPYERITMLCANTEQEQYSSGGMRGEMMAYRMDLTDDRPTPGRGVGVLIGTRMRRKLYREGAKSGIELAIGIDRRATIAAPDGFVDPLRALPRRGEDPGRIDIPFGAYLDGRDLQALLGAVQQATGGAAFPIGIVGGTMGWASATTSACEPRQKIREELAGLGIV